MSLHCQYSETVKINETLGDNALEKSMHHQIKITKSKILHNSHLILPSTFALFKDSSKARSCKISPFSFILYSCEGLPFPIKGRLEAV